MARALSDILGWTVEALVVDVPLSYVTHQNGIHVVHAWVVSPDGQAFDAGGYFDRATLHEDFLTHTSRRWSNDRVEAFHDLDAFDERLKQAYYDDEHWDRVYLPQQLTPRTDEAQEVATSLILPRHAPDLVQALPDGPSL